MSHNCNINPQLTKKVPIIFHNLRSCDSHLISYELKKLDVKIGVTPNRFEIGMAFILNKILVSIDSLQFVNSSLEKLVKSLSDNDFKYLIKEFGSKHLDLLKLKDAYPYEHMNKFERFSEKKILTKNVFADPWKIEQLAIMIKN